MRIKKVRNINPPIRKKINFDKLGKDTMNKLERKEKQYLKRKNI